MSRSTAIHRDYRLSFRSIPWQNRKKTLIHIAIGGKKSRIDRRESAVNARIPLI